MSITGILIELAAGCVKQAGASQYSSSPLNPLRAACVVLHSADLPASTLLKLTLHMRCPIDIDCQVCYLSAIGDVNCAG
jgi:hypothetical protein